ncbi:MAG: hypothetical protein IIB42_10455, partial [Candidatus Marinimicrobia bacterium]|nr:hypothetical protein [Candidatus Neomarinimicrobiota bacterium]
MLRIGNGYFSNPLQLHNASALGGVQFTLNYDAALFSIDTILTTPRSSHMSLQYSEPQAGAAIVLLYNDSTDVISAGSGSILEIRFGHVQDSSSTIN